MKWVGRQPILYNKTMTSKDTEYSQDLRSGTTKLLVQCRGQYDVKLAFAATSGTNYLTIKAGSVYYEDIVEGGTRTLYFQCGTDGQVLEIIGWIR